MDDIYFDARYIRVGRHDGISRFSTGLVHELHKVTPLVVLVHDLRQLEILPKNIRYEMIPQPTSLLEPLLALKLNKLGAKIVFSPMQTMGSFGRKFKLVLTVHDFIYYRHPAPPPTFSLLVRLLWRLYHLSYWPQRLLLSRPDAVVTVSKTTEALIQKHRLTKKKVWVVPNAAELVEEGYVTPSAPVSKKLVYMGSFMDYKNVELLIAGMKFLPGFELHLLSPITKQRQNDLTALGAQEDSVIFHNGVSEQKYHELLSQATALVSASRDEGFGIPLVEAMERGIPVVCSEIEIFKEICGPAGIYFDPNDEEGFADSIKQLTDEDVWRRYSQLGLVQSQNFTWEKSAAILLSVLRDL
jgi:glycosyltransferase involved in cell wall biosynthesis